MNQFNKVVALDTIIFYPEHERALKKLVKNPNIERVPLRYNQQQREWTLPENYTMPEDANIIIWPSSLPRSFETMTPELHEKLKTAQCWTEAGLRENEDAQNLLNRIQDADCVLTCWTNIPDSVLEHINPKAILTWTHEFEHRLNVKKAREKGIYTSSVPDYGTKAVSELVFDGMTTLMQRNHQITTRVKTHSDVVVGVLSELFSHYRQANYNEKKTRNGQFSHQFHKLGRAQKHFAKLQDQSIDNIISEKMLQDKHVGVLENQPLAQTLTNSLGIDARNYSGRDTKAEFYEWLSKNEFIIYDSQSTDKIVEQKIHTISENTIDVAQLPAYSKQLDEMTMGVVGLGRIGTRVAETAHQLGMRVQYNSPTKNPTYKYAELDKLLSTSDVISLNVAAHKAKGLIDQKRVKRIKDEAYFINTSDGNAVDQHTLTQRAQNNEVFMALDVYQGLPTTKVLGLNDNHRGKIKDQLPNHVLWYRAGWKTQESIRTKTYKLIGRMVEALENHQ